MIEGIIEPDAKLIAVDPITGNCAYQISDNHIVKIVRSNHKLSLLEEEEEVGRIVKGSDWTGSIWVAGECLGAYEYSKNCYSVTPYENGRKKPEEKEEIHPLDYLLRFLY